MNVLILDGNPETNGNAFDRYLNDLADELRVNGHQVQRLILRDMEIRYCTGCWGCWVKTPGECVFQDDSQRISQEVIQSDFVLMASPILMGFPSALIKKTQDRLICLVLPYVELVQDECHHRHRYDCYPKLGILLEKSEDSDDEDVQIITAIYKRLALNFKSELIFSALSNQEVKEVAHAIDSI